MFQFLLGKKQKDLFYLVVGLLSGHLAIVFFAAFFGFDGYINIVEGEQIDAIEVRKRATPMKLGFEVRCDKFTVEFYDTGAPKEFRSELSFSENGKEMKKETPLTKKRFLRIYSRELEKNALT